MSPVPLQFVLLLAVAISQIFGGISCCCLGRSLLLPFSNAANAVADSPVSVSQPAGEAACPKCAARPRHDSVTSPGTRAEVNGARTQLCEDGQCRCVKYVSFANTQNESTVVQSFDSSVVDVVASDLPRFLDQAPVRKFEVPIRLGGHSWQSIACVWKN